MGGNSHATLLGVDLTAAVVAVRGDSPYVLTVDAPVPSAAALPAGPLQPGHRTLQAGLRGWVEAQTQRRLGYVEQLYTFGDRPKVMSGASVHADTRTVSIAYLALTWTGDNDRPPNGQWRPWYDFFPWEDRRGGEPRLADTLALRVLERVGAASTAQQKPALLEQVRLTFGVDGAQWDEERALERYEMLYEAGLVTEAWLDSSEQPPPDIVEFAGAPMYADHRRILATAVSRLRAKIKYRPVLFELMPPRFTFLQLQRTAEALSGMALHKQNFRRLVAQQGLVEETGELATDTGGRPAKLLRFRRDVVLERPAPGLRVGATRRGGYP